MTATTTTSKPSTFRVFGITWDGQCISYQFSTFAAAETHLNKEVTRFLTTDHPHPCYPSEWNFFLAVEGEPNMFRIHANRLHNKVTSALCPNTLF